MDEVFQYSIEFASGYRDADDGLTLNIHLYADFDHMIKHTSNFAWQYACNMFSDKTELRSMERKQIMHVIEELFGFAKPVIEEKYSGRAFPHDLINADWEDQRNHFKFARLTRTRGPLIWGLWRKRSQLYLMQSIHCFSIRT